MRNHEWWHHKHAGHPTTSPSEFGNLPFRVVFFEGPFCHCDNSGRLSIPPNLAATNETLPCILKCCSVLWHSLEESVEDLKITSKRWITQKLFNIVVWHVWLSLYSINFSFTPIIFQVDEASKFLSNPNVVKHGVEQKTAFLRKKGLTESEITAAYDMARKIIPPTQVSLSMAQSTQIMQPFDDRHYWQYFANAVLFQGTHIVGKETSIGES